MGLFGKKNVIEVGLKLNDQLSAGMKRGEGAVKGFRQVAQSHMAGVGRAFNVAAGPIRGLFRSLTSLKGLLVGFAGFKMTQFAVSIEGTERHFRVLLKSLGEDAPQTLDRLRKAFKGTVADIDLMKRANEALVLGAVKSGEELEMLATLSRRLGRAMGVDMDYAFKSLVVGIARQSRLWLDNIGLIVKVEDAQKKYAAQLGITAGKLNDTEKRQAFMNAVIAAAQSKLKMLGEDVEGVADAWAKLGAAAKNTATDILRGFTPVLTEIFEKIRRWVVDMKPEIMGFFADFLRAADQAIPPIIKTIQNLTQAVWDLTEPMRGFPRIWALWQTEAHKVDLEKAWDAAFNLAQRKPRGKALDPRARRGFLPSGMPAGARSGPETREAWLERMVRLGILDDYSAEVRALRAAFEKKYQLDAIYADLWKDFGDRTRDYPQPKTFLGEAAKYFEEGIGKAQAQQWDDWLALQDDMEREAEMRRDFAGGMRDRVRGPLWDQGQLPQLELLHDKLRAIGPGVDYVKTGFDGIGDALVEIEKKGTDTFSQLREATLNVADLISDRLADTLLAVGESTKDLGQKFKDMAAAIIKDIMRIILRIQLMRLVAAGAGALGGLFGTSQTAINMPKMMQHGGIAYGPTITGEGPHPEAHIPLPDGRTVPVTLQGGGGGDTHYHHYEIHATDAESFDRLFLQSAGRQQNTLGMINQRQYQDRPRLRRAYS